MAILLNDQVIQPIFSASLKLHGLLETANIRQLAARNPAIDQLDDAVHNMRNILFNHDPASEGDADT